MTIETMCFSQSFNKCNCPVLSVPLQHTEGTARACVRACARVPLLTPHTTFPTSMHRASLTYQKWG